MELQLISLETAKLAKEKGVNLKHDLYYCPQYDKGLLDYDYGVSSNIDKNGYDSYPAYTQSLLQMWLRQDHNIHVEVWFDNAQDDGFPYTYEVYKQDNSEIELDGMYSDSYEEAFEHALKRGLELIQTNKKT